MIIPEDITSDVTIIGDIKSNKISIDPNNINFLVTILSTNLYSNPISSFIRETVSNAWDSHVEAGVNEPVVINLGKDTEGKYYCSIRDFGVGLSPQRFEEVYKNIGSSTKRGTNEQIGGFGIGRFSALAYSDVVYITSYYDGTMYQYLMYKDGNSISIDLLDECETELGNGLEVKVYLKNAYEADSFCNAISKQLPYFENLYLVDDTDITSVHVFAERFNSYKIKRYTNFYVNNLDSGEPVNLILGKVKYPVRFNSLSKSYPQYFREYPLSIKFEVGDLEVTPNREEILYSSKNIETIEEKLNLALEEVNELTKDAFVKDATSVDEYLDLLNNVGYYTILEDDENPVNLKIDKSRAKITLNGEKYEEKNFRVLHSTIMGYSGISSSYVLIGSRISAKKVGISLSEILKYPQRYYIGDIGSLKGVTRDFIRATFTEYNTYFIGTNFSIKGYYFRYLRYLKQQTSNRYYSETKYDSKVIKVILKDIFKTKLRYLKVVSDSIVTQEYLDERKKRIKELAALSRLNRTKLSTEEIVVGVLRASERGSGDVVSDSTTITIKDLLKRKEMKVYAVKGDEKIRPLFNLIYGTTNRAILFEVAPRKLKHFQDFPQLVNISDLFDVKHKMIRRIATAMLIKQEVPYLYKLYQIGNLDKVSNKLYVVVQELHRYMERYLSSRNTSSEVAKEILNLCTEKKYFDEVTKALLYENLELLKKAQFIPLFTGSSSYSIPDDRINILTDYILARKLFRPNLSAVKKLRSETILNIKPNENTQNGENPHSDI